MATVIRSAHISGSAITLTLQRPQDPQLSRSRSSDDITPASTNIVEPQAPKPQLDIESSVKEQLTLALRAQEEQLKEREHLLLKRIEEDRERVLQEAYAEGMKRGELAGAKRFDEQTVALHNLIASLNVEFKRGIANLEDVMVGIAYEAVCKIVGNAMHDEDGVWAVVREVISRVRDQERMVLRVPPRDYDFLCHHLDAYFKEGMEGKYQLIADDRVSLGGCMIETSGGTLDGRLEIQMQQLRDTLLAAHKMLPE